jgi:transposase InsO family protein
MPKEIWLPEEEEILAYINPIDELPPELQRFSDVFAEERSKILPPRKATDHAIDTVEDATPPYGPIYPLSQMELAELRKYIDENIEAGRIRPSQSPAGAPILFVPKTDGGLRLCVDYRGLNKVTVKNRYPLPLVSEILDRVAGSAYFSKIDVKDAYYRIRIREGDEWKTAFRTRYGHFEYTVMPFGLTNAPATFQNYIHTALHGLLDVVCVAYLDDILIFSKDRESHTDHICQVLERMRQYGLYAKASKCTFYQAEVEFLGFIIGRDGVSMDQRRVDAIVSWEIPKSYHDIQVFIGFCNFYRRFIEGFSLIALPLTSLLKGSKNGKKPGAVELNDKETRAFRQLIDAFKCAPLLRHFDPQRQIRLETDASNLGMAGILSQPDDLNCYHPIAFWSRKFTGAEINYGTPDQELFAIVYSFKHWRHYLEGARFTVEVLTDHHNLKSFMSHPKLNGRQARWLMYLTPFDFLIKHRPGKTNPADGPSRKTGSSQEDAPGAELLEPFRQRIATVEALFLNDFYSGKFQFEPDETSLQGDPELSTDPIQSPQDRGTETDDWSVWWELNRDSSIPHSVIQSVRAKDGPYTEGPSEDLMSSIQRLQAEDPETRRRKAAIQAGHKGLKGWTVDASGLIRFRDRFYIPSGENLRRTLVSLYHDDPLAGHFGRNRTEELLRRRFHWVHLQRSVSEYVDDCPICQGNAAPRHRPYGTLESLPIPPRPWAELSMDFITGLPPTIFKGEYVDAILVIVDRYSKWSLFFPVPSTIDAAGLAELFHNEVELRYGPPDGVVSDRGSIFTSKFWSKLCFLSHIKRRLSTAFHPQTDGQTERMNQTLEHYLRCFVDTEQLSWPKLLRSAEYACNNAINASTGKSPFMILMAYSPDFRLRTEVGPLQEEVPAAEARIEKLKTLRNQLEEHWRKASKSQAKSYNERHKPFGFKRGDLVMLSTRNIKLKTPSKKLAPRFIGPFRVLNAVGSQAYRLCLPEQYSRIHNVFHVSLLEPWKRREGDDTDLPMPELEDDDEWEVEEVKDEKLFDGDSHFLIKWKGWPSEYNQWVPELDMENAKGAITKYRKQKKRQH